jgi:N-acetylmuramoyl-L-alanine amidase
MKLFTVKRGEKNMFKLKNLLQDIFSSIKHVPKKAYTNGLIVITGCIVLAVLYIGVNGFFGSRPSAVCALEDNQEEEAIASENRSLEDEEIMTQLDSEIAQYKQYSAQDEKDDLVVARMAAPMKEPENSSNERELHTASFKAKEPDSKLVSISAKDYEAITRIVEAEATNEDLIGKILIANVVLNRVKSSNFPNNIYDVVHQKIKGKAQFSPIDDGRYYKLKVTNSTKKAVESAFNGEDYSQGSLFFVARSLASSKAVSWFDNNLTKVLKHGVHEFFK